MKPYPLSGIFFSGIFPLWLLCQKKKKKKKPPRWKHIQAFSSSHPGLALYFLTEWAILKELGHRRCWDWKWGMGVQKWWGRVEILLSAQYLMLQSPAFSHGYLWPHPMAVSWEWSIELLTTDHPGEPWFLSLITTFFLKELGSVFLGQPESSFKTFFNFF